MGIYERRTEFAGYPVSDFDATATLENPSGTVFRLSDVPEYTPTLVGLFGCVGMLLGVLIGVAFAIVTRELLLAFGIGVVSVIVCGALPSLVSNGFRGVESKASFRSLGFVNPAAKRKLAGNTRRAPAASCISPIDCIAFLKLFQRPGVIG